MIDLKDRLNLFKFRIVAMVILTTLLTYLWKVDVVEPIQLFYLLLGSALISASGLALNNLIEIEYDRQMLRTQSRPLVQKRIQKKEALFWIGLFFGLGLGIFYTQFDWLTWVVAVMTWVGYVMVYTPLKRKTSWNTLVGAIVGAMPPVWAALAVDPHLSWWGVSGFLVLFFWQMPHFYSIAWIYKEQYKKAGFVMVAMNDDSGYYLWRQTVLWMIGLSFIALVPFQGGITNRGAFIFVEIITLIYLVVVYKAYNFKENKLTDQGAKNILIGSFIYLPLWFLVMIGGKL